MNAEKIYALLGGNARKIFNLHTARIEKNEKACLCLFDQTVSWTYHTQDSRSKSRNSAFNLTSFTGRPIGTIREEKIYLNHP
jgi:dihydroorotase-like cyclic amidohydrolase